MEFKVCSFQGHSDVKKIVGHTCVAPLSPRMSQFAPQNQTAKFTKIDMPEGHKDGCPQELGPGHT